MIIKCYIIGKGSLLIKSAEMLMQNGHKVLGILTKDEEVVKWAEENNITYKIYTDYNSIKLYLQENSFDYLFSIVNNIFIKEDILELPKIAAVNFHDSPLPRYAGANATSWAIMQSETDYAITWHKVENNYDSGDVLEQIIFPISKDETVFSLNAKCFEKAIEGFGNLLDKIQEDRVVGQKQDLSKRTYISRSITTDLEKKYMWNAGLITEEMTAEEIMLLVHSLDYKTYDNQLARVKVSINRNTYIVCDISITNEKTEYESGTVVSITKDGIQVTTKSNDIIINKIRDFNNQIVEFSIFVCNNNIPCKLFFDNNNLDQLKEFDKAVSKYEDFWIQEFNKASFTDIPYIGNGNLKNKKVKIVKLSTEIISNLQNKYTLAQVKEVLFLAFLVYIKRISAVDNISIGYKGSNLQNLSQDIKLVYSEYVPFSVNIKDGETWEELIEKIQYAKELVKSKGTYTKDLFTRYKQLKSKSDNYNICYSECGLENLNKELLTVISNESQSLEVLDSMDILCGNIEFQVIDTKDNLQAIIKCSEKVTDEYLSLLNEQIEFILANIEHGGRIGEISLVTEETKETMLKSWNNTQLDYESEKGYSYLFEDIVSKFPDYIAVEKNSEYLTYSDLNKKANQLANYLISKSVKKGDFIGILFNKNVNMLVCVLAVLKVGAVYLPIDKKYPIERIKFIIDDSNLKMLITNERLMDKQDGLCANIIILEDINDELMKKSDENLSLNIGADDLAYIIYTSGSTGKPKGVMVSHRGLNNLKVAQKKLFNLNENDKVLQFSSFSFDASIWEISLAINVGATIVLGDDDDVLPGEGLVKFINEKEITIISMPPSALAMIDEDSKMVTIHTIIVGSESCWIELIKKWRSKVRFFNGYGPTEATVCVSFREYFGEEELVTIGTPIANTQIYILDKDMRPVPVGVPGEIYIGGAGIAKGYLNNADLSAEKFISNIYGDQGLLYKSGDIGKYATNGDIEFVGRIDNQVKVRGFRIELEEIENVALENKNIKKAICLLKEDDKDKKIVLYFIQSEKDQVSSKELRRFMENKLPSYMIPAHFVAIDEFPLMPNGKVSKNDLLKIDIFKDDTKKNLVPRNNTEEILSILWSKALKRKNINITDDFFEIGGHSLLAIQIITNLNKEQDLSIPISAMFEHSTIQALAKYIKSSKTSEFNPLIKLQAEGDKKPVFAVHPGDGNVFSYTDLVRELGKEQPFYGFQAYGVEEGTIAKNSFVEMAAIYINEMKLIQKKGPYIIFGYCAGGTIAFEMARQLIATGEKVEKLILFDARAPHTYGPMDEVQNFVAFARNFEGISDADLFQLYAKKMNVDYTDEEIYTCLANQTLDERFDLLWICSQELSILPKEVDVNYLKRLFNVWLGLSDMMTYKVTSIDCEVILFRAKDDKSNIQMNLNHLGWNLARDDLKIIEINGNHFTILKYPNVIDLAKELKSCLY